MNESRDKIYNTSRQLLLTNTVCEDKLGDIMQRKGTALDDNVNLVDITPDDLK